LILALGKAAKTARPASCWFSLPKFFRLCVSPLFLWRKCSRIFSRWMDPRRGLRRQPHRAFSARRRISQLPIA